MTHPARSRIQTGKRAPLTPFPRKDRSGRLTGKQCPQTDGEYRAYSLVTCGEENAHHVLGWLGSCGHKLSQQYGACRHRVTGGGRREGQRPPSRSSHHEAAAACALSPLLAWTTAPSRGLTLAEPGRGRALLGAGALVPQTLARCGARKRDPVSL